MRLILTIPLIFIVSMGMAQSKQKWSTTDSIYMPVKYHYDVLASDTAGEIFSFTMTGDTSRLKPIDTSFYTMANVMYREVNYKFFADRNMVLTVRSYNDRSNWLFFGIQLTPFEAEKKVQDNGRKK